MHTYTVRVLSVYGCQWSPSGLLLLRVVDQHVALTHDTASQVTAGGTIQRLYEYIAEREIQII